MYQISQDPDKKVIGVKSLNDVWYTQEDLKLFAETACVEIGLNNLKNYIERCSYSNSDIKYYIANMASGKPNFPCVNLTDNAVAYHKDLFDVMYIKTLRDMPLMINGDRDLIPVVKWRLKIGK